MNPYEHAAGLRATVNVSTFKAGLLSRLAHDLRLSVGTFEIALQGSHVRAWFELDSLRVDGIVRSGVVDPDGLSDQDKARITRTIREEILLTGAHPRAEYTGQLRPTGDAWSVDGTLRLRGVSSQQPCAIERSGRSVLVRSELVPSRFGIRPYAALGGAIRLQDRVLLTGVLELADDSPEALLQNAYGARWSAFS
jgi:hypothetical protein